MMVLMTLTWFLNMKNPLYLAMMVLGTSLLSANLMFKITITSWLTFMLILTFSSGMMTLFMYTTALISNEKTKKKDYSMKFMILLLISVVTPMKAHKETKESMKTFSSKTMILIMTSILMLTMVAISNQGHHPNQTLTTSY